MCDSFASLNLQWSWCIGGAGLGQMLAQIFVVLTFLRISLSYVVFLLRLSERIEMSQKLKDTLILRFIPMKLASGFDVK